MAQIDRIRYEHFEVYVRADGSPWELGRGAMGITYKAHDTNLHVDVALKVISEKCFSNPTARKRFEREARAAAKLRHPNIAGVYFFASSEANCCYAMELVEGETVEQALQRNGVMEAGMALEIALQVTRALGAAEKYNIVHRDLKPSNIMLSELDGELLVKVIDFGLAKQIGNSREAGLTIRGFVGTPHFSSPEQLNEQELDTRSDIYSLGATLWFMLSGKPPFTGTIVQIVSQHLTAPLPMESLAAQPLVIQKLLASMLAKDPADRPQTPGELRKRIVETLAVVRPDRNFEGKAFTPDKTDGTIDAETAFSLNDIPTTATIRKVTLPHASPSAATNQPSASRTRPASLLRHPSILAGAAAVLLCIAALIGRMAPRSETVAQIDPEQRSAPITFEKRVEDALAAGNLANAISFLALASPPIPNAEKRLDEMVERALREDPDLESPKLRDALLDAAEFGTPKAMVAVGDRAVTNHPHWAILWYEKAAHAGSVPAMLKLAHLCVTGFDGGTPEMDRAFSWFERASAAGNPDGQHALAEYYLYGLGSTPRNPEKAIAILRNAAAQDNPRSLDLLGTCYSKGIGVELSYEKAFRFYQRAVELNHGPSFANLGILYMNGHGPTGKPEPRKAVEFFRKGANAGDTRSMMLLATCLEKGNGVEADPVLAEKWFRAAAKAGELAAIQWCRDRGISDY